MIWGLALGTMVQDRSILAGSGLIGSRQPEGLLDRV